MTTEEQVKQDLLALVQVRNQRIAELELQNLALSRNQCKGECDANGESVQVQKTEGKDKKIFVEKQETK